MARVSSDCAGIHGNQNNGRAIEPEEFVLPVCCSEQWEQWMFKPVPTKPWTNYTIVWPGEEHSGNEIEREHVFICTDGSTFTYLIIGANGKFAAVPKTCFSSLFVITYPGRLFVHVGVGRYTWLPTCPETFYRSSTCAKRRVVDMSPDDRNKEFVSWVQAAVREDTQQTKSQLTDPFVGFPNAIDVLQNAKALERFRTVCGFVRHYAAANFGVVPLFDVSDDMQRYICTELLGVSMPNTI